MLPGRRDMGLAVSSHHPGEVGTCATTAGTLPVLDSGAGGSFPRARKSQAGQASQPLVIAEAAEERPTRAHSRSRLAPRSSLLPMATVSTTALHHGTWILPAGMTVATRRRAQSCGSGLQVLYECRTAFPLLASKSTVRRIPSSTLHCTPWPSGRRRYYSPLKAHLPNSAARIPSLTIMSTSKASNCGILATRDEYIPV
jgi:hypothetical protein